MQPFTNKQLYIMNGGNKLYIHKDGFGDVYHATPAEEGEWAQEVIAAALVTIDSSENSADLNNAVENLRFHGYEGLDVLLRSKLKDSGPERRSVFELSFRHSDPDNNNADKEQVEMIYQDLVQSGNKRMNDVFSRFDNYKNKTAKLFILTCVEGDDDQLFVQASIMLGRWAYSGLPALRQHRLLELLQPENRNLPAFRLAVEELKYIFSNT